MFLALLGFGVVSLASFSWIAGKACLGLFKSHYKTRSVYQPLAQDAVTEQKSFVFIVTAKDCESYVEKNLRSIYEQTKEDFRVVYIDDNSSDRTYFTAYEVIKKHDRLGRTTLKKNPEEKPIIELLYSTIQNLDNSDIVIMLDGKDWLAHEKALETYNTYYNDENVWLTYGQYASYPDYERGEARERFLLTKKQIGLRSSPWIYSQYSTFYAGLFKRIKMRDLLYEGEFFKYRSNRAMMMPMLEMAEDHAVFIPDILYVNNQENSIEKSHEEIANIRLYSRHIRSLKPYQGIQQHPKEEVTVSQEADLFIFSDDRPMQLYSFLETQRKNSNNIYDVYVVYSASDAEYEHGYDVVKKSFPEVCFLRQHPTKSDFKKNVASLIKKATSAHVIIAEDQMLLKEQLQLEKAISYLEKTGAYGFYFSLGLNLSQIPEKYFPVEEEAIAWEFREADAEWQQSHSLGMVLHRKDDLVENIKTINFNSIQEFKKAWSHKNQALGLGLCFFDSKSVYNPLEVFRARTQEREELYSKDELNKLFLDGMKMNVLPVHRLKNKETKLEFIPSFVSR